MIPDKTTLFIIKACVLGVLVTGLWFHGYGKGRAAGTEALQRHLAADAVLAVAASEDARKQEQAHALALSAIAKEHEDDKEAAKRDHARLVADLRRGTVRLQDHWTCPAAVSATGTGAGIADEIARLREQGAADLIAAADECDAQVLGLQAVTQQDRASQ